MEKLAKPVSVSQVLMTELVLPTHTNQLDTIFGGTIMAWVDIAAAICGTRHAERPVVTASIDGMHFIAPVYTGWIVTLKASVNYVHRTSMEIGVRIDAENPIEKLKVHTASAYLTFVALDAQGNPMPVPGIITENDDQRRRSDEAQIRRETRLENKKKIDAKRASR